MGETDEMVNQKTKSALENGLVPIICVGETLKDFEKGKIEISAIQAKEAVQGLMPDEIQKIILAYEPVWAIGTDKPATPKHTERVIYQIRQELASIYGKDKVARIPILYGGSVDSKNAWQFLDHPAISGLLIGRASCDPIEFIKIVKGKEQE